MFLKLTSGKGLIIQAMGNLSFRDGFKYFMVQDQKIISFFKKSVSVFTTSLSGSFQIHSHLGTLI